MAGKLYIDGIDVYSKYGVLVAVGGYNDLVNYPATKKVESNDWPEEDGEEFDLSAPVLDSREVSIPLAAHGCDYDIGAFIELLSDKSYHTFEFREIGRTFRLRLVSQSNLTIARRLGLFSLRFADDFPLGDYTYQVPSSTMTSQKGYLIDGVDLSQYGICILDGSRDEIAKMPSVKNNWLCNIESAHGVLYDGEIVRFKTKEVKLNCLMRAATLEEFWRNYDALFFDLTRAGERILVVSTPDSSFSCFYKMCSTRRFVSRRGVWFEFELTLVFTLS